MNCYKFTKNAVKINLPFIFKFLCVSRKVFLKHKVNYNTPIGAIQDLPWCNILYADTPVKVLNKHLSLLVGCCVPTKFIHVINKDKPWFDNQCIHAFDLKQETHLQWSSDHSLVNWSCNRSLVNKQEFVCCQMRANETYSDAYSE